MASGYAFTHAADIAKSWAARAIEKARIAAKKRDRSIEVIAHEIAAHLFDGSFEQYRARYKLAAAKAVWWLKKRGFKASRSFRRIDACRDPDIYSDGSFDQPERYRLVFNIRW